MSEETCFYLGKCKDLQEQLHECPFDQEINNGHKMCNCCKFCTQECADDV